MKLRDLIASVHMPYRNVVYCVLTVASLALWLPSWLPPRYFYLRYIILSIIFMGLLYFAFWVYKGGYRKQGLLMAIGYTVVVAVSLAIFIYAEPVLAGG